MEMPDLRKHLSNHDFSNDKIWAPQAVYLAAYMRVQLGLDVRILTCTLRSCLRGAESIGTLFVQKCQSEDIISFGNRGELLRDVRWAMLSRLEAQGVRIYPSVKQLWLMTTKWRYYEELQARALPIAPFLKWVGPTSAAAVAQQLLRTGWEAALVKPSWSVGRCGGIALGIFKLNLTERSDARAEDIEALASQLQGGLAPCRMGPDSFHLEDAALVRFEPMVSSAWELRMHFVDKRYRYTVATKGVLDAAGGEEMDADDDDREDAYENHLESDADGEAISYDYRRLSKKETDGDDDDGDSDDDEAEGDDDDNDDGGDKEYFHLEESEDFDETGDEYDSGRFGTFADEELVTLKPTLPWPSPAALRAKHIQPGVIPTARKAEAIALAQRALEILPDAWGRYPFTRVDVICCLQGTDELFINEMEPLPNWLMHHVADPEAIVHDIAVAHREFAFEGRVESYGVPHDDVHTGSRNGPEVKSEL